MNLVNAYEKVIKIPESRRWGDAGPRGGVVLLLEGQEYCYEMPYDAAGGVRLLATVKAALNVGEIMTERRCILSSKYIKLSESVYAIEIMCFKPAFNKPGKFYICIDEKQDEIVICIRKSCSAGVA